MISGVTPGLRARLPTEAEWEYACRAGTITATWWGDGAEQLSRWVNGCDAAYQRAVPKHQGPWVAGDDGFAGPAPCRALPANPWGLHGMLGNVNEWVQDWHAPYPRERLIDPSGPSGGTQRVLRGGQCSSPPDHLRAGQRFADLPTLRSWAVGFRFAADP